MKRCWKIILGLLLALPSPLFAPDGAPTSAPVPIYVRGRIDSQDPEHAPGPGAGIKEVPAEVKSGPSASELSITLRPSVGPMIPPGPLVVSANDYAEAMDVVRSGRVLVTISETQGVLGIPSLVLVAGEVDRNTRRMPIQRILCRVTYLEPAAGGEFTVRTREFPLNEVVSWTSFLQRDLGRRAGVPHGPAASTSVAILRLETTVAGGTPAIKVRGARVPGIMVDQVAWVARRSDLSRARGTIDVAAVPAFTLIYNLNDSGETHASTTTPPRLADSTTAVPISELNGHAEVPGPREVGLIHGLRRWIIERNGKCGVITGQIPLRTQSEPFHLQWNW